MARDRTREDSLRKSERRRRSHGFTSKVFDVLSQREKRVKRRRYMGGENEERVALK